MFRVFMSCPSRYYSPALKKWGYIGFALSFRNSDNLLFRNSVTINFSFPLNIWRTNGHNLTNFVYTLTLIISRLEF